ncbi:MAG: class I SAM-dependent methyltransferase [Bacteroidota bacterium]
MLRLLRDYVAHVYRCKSVYSLHSPFVYEWHRKVLRAKASEETNNIEAFRKSLLRDKREINLKDFGAGSGNLGAKQETKTVGELVRKASRKKASGKLLHHLCKYYQPKRCLEFGTHIGISSLYQASALEDSAFYTMEGDPSLAAIASDHFQKFEIEAQQIVGRFEDILAKKLSLSSYQPDYVFVDGNHRYAPTLDYFQRLHPIMPENGIIVFDDIYWSNEMKKAWQEISQHAAVSVSIDLFFMGICFLKRKQAKEHFHFLL